jgi:P4 family phage/plasmid primase-like protien
MDQTETFLSNLFDNTEHKIEFRSFANDGGKPMRPIFTRTMDELAVHMQRFDKDGRGFFFGCATRVIGAATGQRKDCAEINFLWLDVDCDREKIERTDVIRELSKEPYPATYIVESGGGLHAYWKLTEPINIRKIDTDTEYELIRALKKLASVFAGDKAVCELARVMRLPGSHNSKYGDMRPVNLFTTLPREYHIEDLIEWLEEEEPRIVTNKKEAKPNGEDNYEQFLGDIYKEPMDVDKTLDEMQDGNVHMSQLRSIASLVSKGHSNEEIVEIVLPKTLKQDENWTEGREYKKIIKSANDARKKFDVKPKKEKPAEKPAEKSNAIPILGEAVLEVWQADRGELLATGGETYSYNKRSGYWNCFDRELTQELEVEIHKAITTLGANPTLTLINNIKKWIQIHPHIYKKGIRFNDAGLIICSNCAVDPKSGMQQPHSPKHYALYGVDCQYQPDAKCPTWLEYLKEAFKDREDAEDLTRTVQEWFGAALVRNKPRELMKALVAFGPSRTGKTVMAGVCRTLIGGQTCALRTKEFSEQFGRQPLINCSGWIADDAVSPGDLLDAESWKVIVSGEPTSIPRKNLEAWEGSLDIPVCITSNTLPRVKDQSEAVYNRTIFLPMTVPQSEEDVAGRIIISEIRDEIAGVLNWAIEGWQRLIERGYFKPPKTIIEATQKYMDDQNPCGTWLTECIERDNDIMIDRRDLHAACQGFQVEYEGIPLNRTLGARKVYAGLLQRFPHIIDYRKANSRLFVGIKLNDDGVRFLENHKERNSYETVGSGAGLINQDIPDRSVPIERAKRDKLL